MDWRKELAKQYGGQGGKRGGRARHTPGVMNRTEAAFAENLQGRWWGKEIAGYDFESIKFQIGW